MTTAKPQSTIEITTLDLLKATNKFLHGLLTHPYAKQCQVEKLIQYHEQEIAAHEAAERRKQ